MRALNHIIQRVEQVLSDMTRWQQVEYLLLIVEACVIPLSWRLAMWMLVPLGVVMGVRMVVEHRCGNRYSKLVRTGLWGLVILYAIYAFSLLYTSNMPEGIAMLIKKLPLVVVPVLFLLSGCEYLSAWRLRVIGMGYVLACAVYSALYLVQAVVHKGAFLTLLFQVHGFMQHHTYYAMYYILALFIAVRELVVHSDRFTRWGRIGITVCAVLHLIFVVAVQSRAGMLLVSVGGVVLLCYLFFVQRCYVVACVLASVVLGIGTVYVQSHHRLLDTVKEAMAHDRRDVRYEIASNSMEVIKRNVWFGVGVGDRMDELIANHENSVVDGDETSKWRYNTHNQYLDSWLAIGIMGLLLMVLLMVAGVVEAWKRKGSVGAWLFAFMVIVGVSALFESILERQMGIIFFVFFFCLFLATTDSSKSLNAAL